MKNTKRIFAAGLAAIVLLAVVGIADAAEIKLASASGIQAIIDDLGPKFERASGHKLAITFGTLGVTMKRIQGGEAADIVIIPRQGIDELVKGGKALAGNVTVIAASKVGVAVRKGAAKPDISSPDAFKRALLAAKSITYLDPAAGGASGVVVNRILERLGIVNEMKAKTILATSTPNMGAMIASGKAELVMNQIQNLNMLSGIDIVGPLPGNAEDATVFAAAIMNGTKNAAAAKALVDFLRAPNSVKVIKAKGMEPG